MAHLIIVTSTQLKTYLARFETLLAQERASTNYETNKRILPASVVRLFVSHSLTGKHQFALFCPPERFHAQPNPQQPLHPHR